MDILNLLFLQKEITDLQKESDNGTLYIFRKLLFIFISNYYYRYDIITIPTKKKPLFVK